VTPLLDPRTGPPEGQKKLGELYLQLVLEPANIGGAKVLELANIGGAIAPPAPPVPAPLPHICNPPSTPGTHNKPNENLSFNFKNQLFQKISKSF